MFSVDVIAAGYNVPANKNEASNCYATADDLLPGCMQLASDWIPCYTVFYGAVFHAYLLIFAFTGA